MDDNNYCKLQHTVTVPLAAPYTNKFFFKEVFMEQGTLTGKADDETTWTYTGDVLNEAAAGYLTPKVNYYTLLNYL
jgi:hypothetical protein